MRHAEHVLNALSCSRFASRSNVAASWRRSHEAHGIDLFERAQQHVIEQEELKRTREQNGQFISVAAPRLDKLFNLVGASGCTVVLTNAEGVILEQRNSDADNGELQKCGLLPGAMWGEETQGTNGIGTCLAERRSVIIHRDQHYLPKNIAMTCIGVPIHGIKGELIGVLDVSSARRDQTNELNRLIATSTKYAANEIEAHNFRAHFARERIVLAGHGNGDQTALVAIDVNDCVVGATRAARKLFNWKLESDLLPIAATDILEETPESRGFARAEKAAIMKALARSNWNMAGAARDLGIGRATLYRKLNRLGIKRAD